MPVPQFVLDLRTRIGHDLLWLTGLVAVVFDDEGRVLLTERADTGEWSLPSGILEPGEQPAAALVREVAEETGVRVEVERLTSVLTDDEPVTYPNGDVSQYLALTFRCRYLGGDAVVADDENTAVGWFALDALPPLNDRNRQRLTSAVTEDTQPYFRR